jgi:murein tripeptide amidase MpaA
MRKQFKQKYKKCKEFLRQTDDSKGKVQRLLEQAFEEEMMSFAEPNSKELQAIKPQWSEFGSKMIAYLRDHYGKRAIVLTSRVHPGEPQASFMLEGSLKMLLSDSPLARELRHHFVFRIVPMLNPDGVVYGNYRCSLLGQDLNRQWLLPNRHLQPSIFQTKQMIKFLSWERGVLLYCDMHGHSRKENVFFYGCTYKNYEHEGRIKNAQLRVLPLLCCHKNSSFSFGGCSFRIEKVKEATGRVVVFREFNIMNSFTLECSFHGK